MPRNRMICLLSCILLSTAIFFPAFPIAGIGIQWGFDNSLSLPDKVGEQAILTDLSLNVSSFGGLVPSGYNKTSLSGADLPITISRVNWKRNWFNLGGKIFVDIIPFINTAELSVNYGMWEYEGSITYPTSIDFNGNAATANSNIKDIATINYATTKITSEALGLGNPFVKNTPYAKLQFDLTARKNLLKFPPVVNIFKLYAGTGLSLEFATPLLSAAFIEKTLGTTLAAVHDVGSLQSNLFNQDNDAMVKIGKQFMKELMTPHMGMHFDLGVNMKFPVMPFGIFVDGKYLIPFGDLDKNVDELKATGFLVNSGISLSF
jgi:hypothetical protein